MLIKSAKLLLNSNRVSRLTNFSRTYTPRRALLYVPGDDLRKIKKTFNLDVDCIAMDCEDGVAVNRKSEARCTIRDMLEMGKPEKCRKYDLGVRVNSIDTDWFRDDLKSILTARCLPDTILLPKVRCAEHINIFSDEINCYKRPNCWINLIIYIESALAFVNLVDICKTAEELSKRSQFKPAALVFGSDDFCADIGVSRTEDSREISYARQKLVLCAKAFDLQAIDMVYIQYKDLEGLQCQAEEGCRLGYTGKQVIHPGQIDIVQQAFLPGKNQIDWAEELLAAFEQYQRSGKGAFTFRGSMIDMPTMRQAKNIVELVHSTKSSNW